VFSAMCHVGVGVSDLERSIRFYTEVLEMNLTARRELPNGTVLAMLSCASGTEVELIYRKEPGPTAPESIGIGIRHIAFSVPDIDASVSVLKSRGVSFHREPAAKPAPMRVAFFRDPDGVDIELVEMG